MNLRLAVSSCGHIFFVQSFYHPCIPSFSPPNSEARTDEWRGPGGAVWLGVLHRVSHGGLGRAERAISGS